MFGLGRLQMVLAAVLLAIVTHLVAYWAGWTEGSQRERDRWATEKLQILAAAESRAKILRGQGDQLAAELERARANVRIVYQERIKYIIRRASPAVQCLTPDVTAALNRQPIREYVERPGEPRQEVAPTGGTSEAAAAEWIANAQSAHEQCRSQVERLAQWVRNAAGGER